MSDVTRIFERVHEGDPNAGQELLPLVYEELRKLAAVRLAHEAPGHTLQPTALVHEAYMRLVKADVSWQDRTHFMSVAARVMRRVLVEHARARRARKRGGDETDVTVTESVEGAIGAPAADPVDILVLDAALDRLQAYDSRQAEIVELSYFGGMTYPEVGEALGISEATVHRSLRHARAWLRRELSGDEASAP
jgi:RNA polymerase sigma factor (TIGR02999 family)